MAKIKKQYNRRYTVTDNKVIEDERLSWKARGIFTYLWSKSDDWDFYELEVSKHSTDGRDSLRSGLKELEKFGYLIRKRIRNKNGQVKISDWILSDIPMLDNPTQVKPTQDSTTLPSTKEPNTDLPSTEGGGEGLQKVIQNFQKNIGVLNGKNINDLQVWTEDLSADVINYAVDIAADNNAQTYSYVNAILKRWYQQNVRTLEQAKANNVKKKQSNQRTNNQQSLRGVESEEYGW